MPYGVLRLILCHWGLSAAMRGTQACNPSSAASNTKPYRGISIDGYCTSNGLFTASTCRWRPPAFGRGCVKTQNHILSFRFWRFLMKAFAQDRTTIDFTTVFLSIEIVAICFDTASAAWRRRTRRGLLPTWAVRKRLYQSRSRAYTVFGGQDYCMSYPKDADSGLELP
jgi:hypothetical protein